MPNTRPSVAISATVGRFAVPATRRRSDTCARASTSSAPTTASISSTSSVSVARCTNSVAPPPASGPPSRTPFVSGVSTGFGFSAFASVRRRYSVRFGVFCPTIGDTASGPGVTVTDAVPGSKPWAASSAEKTLAAGSITDAVASFCGSDAMSLAAWLPASHNAARSSTSLCRRPVGAGDKDVVGAPTKRVLSARTGTTPRSKLPLESGPSGVSGSVHVPTGAFFEVPGSGSPHTNTADGSVAYPTRSSDSSPFCHSSSVTLCAGAQPMSGSDITAAGPATASIVASESYPATRT